MGRQTIEQAIGCRNRCRDARRDTVRYALAAACSGRCRASIARRRFIGIIPGVLLASTRVSRAQGRRTYRIGMLEPIPATQNGANMDAFRRGLRDRGYVEGRNLVIEYRSAEGHAERFPTLADDLIRLGVELIITRGTPATTAAKRATETIPVVMATMGEPVPIVSSFARPGANVTGMTTYSTELSAKRVELLKELVPTLSRVGLLHDMGNTAAGPEWDETLKAARALALDAELLDVRNEPDLESAFARTRRSRIDGLVVGADGLTQMHRASIVALADRMQLPAIYPGRDFVDAGGLISYAVDYADLYYRFASFVDRIFKGARPGELPIEQPERFELVINVTTAAKLGLTIPRQMRLRADALIR
jgi:putative tryptophan/tyrosine transport system substrate-binding protein